LKAVLAGNDLLLVHHLFLEKIDIYPLCKLYKPAGLPVQCQIKAEMGD
jgi:hypothetical protein